MPIFTWTVQALVIDETSVSRLKEEGRTEEVVILVDDEELLRCRYDEHRQEWVEAKTAHLSGNSRAAKGTLKELIDWLLPLSTQSILVDKVSKRVQAHFDAYKLRSVATELRSQAEKE